MAMHRARARAFFLKMHRTAVHEHVDILADEIAQAEARGRAEMLRIVRGVVGEDAWLRVLQGVAESPGITPLDGSTQPGDHVTDEHRATAPATE